MTDIREKVARAICLHDALRLHPDEPQVHRNGITGEPEKRPAWMEHLAQADAALSACGHAEIVEALEYVLMDVENNEYALSTHARQLIDAALSKARGET